MRTRAWRSAHSSRSANGVSRAGWPRVQVTSVEMQRRGYTLVKVPVDCDTGESLGAPR